MRSRGGRRRRRRRRSDSSATAEEALSQNECTLANIDGRNLMNRMRLFAYRAGGGWVGGGALNGRHTPQKPNDEPLNYVCKVDGRSKSIVDLQKRERVGGGREGGRKEGGREGGRREESAACAICDFSSISRRKFFYFSPSQIKVEAKNEIK